MKRRELLRSTLAVPAVAAGAAPAMAAEEAAVEAQRRRDFRGMNVVLFITDQQRAIQHFPKGWADEHLPGYTRLRKRGIEFENAFCNACMCSPSRATLLTGMFPAQHGVKYTLELDMEPPDNPQVELPPPDQMPNLATVMAAAGYATPFKGKWHMSKPANPNLDADPNPPCSPNEGWVPEDVNRFGFERWNPQDAGANQDVCQAAGGEVDNDGRFMNDEGPVEDGQEGVLAYLRSQAVQDQPFFLTVSLVNPHDVLAYPSNFDAFGYDDSILDSTGIELPATVEENLSTKPSVQRKYLMLTTPLRPKGADEQRTYLNFYGNLMKESDAYLVQVLDALEEQGLLEDTLVICTSDHGEMGTAHGGLIQKNFNFYEETLRVPLVYSNPRLFRRPQRSRALVSHVDFLPTMASLLGVPPGDRADWQGVDYSRVVKNPDVKGPQNYTVFTYDDYQSGQATLPYPTGATHIVSIRESRYKLARYWDADGDAPDEYEMYDLKRDPLEKRNLAAPGARRTRQQQKHYRRLKKKLDRVEQQRLQPEAASAEGELALARG